MITALLLGVLAVVLVVTGVIAHTVLAVMTAAANVAKMTFFLIPLALAAVGIHWYVRRHKGDR